MLNIAMKETPGLFHKQPMGGVGAPPWCVLGLVARGALSYFLHCPKSNKNASRSKNSLRHLCFHLAVLNALSLIRVSFFVSRP